MIYLLKIHANKQRVLQTKKDRSTFIEKFKIQKSVKV